MSKDLDLLEGGTGSIVVIPRFENDPVPSDTKIDNEKTVLNGFLSGLELTPSEDNESSTLSFNVIKNGNGKCDVGFTYLDKSKDPPVAYSSVKELNLTAQPADLKLVIGEYPVPDWEDDKTFDLLCTYSNKTEPIPISNENLLIETSSDSISVVKKDDTRLTIKMIAGKKPLETGAMVDFSIKSKYFSSEITSILKVNIPSVTTFEHVDPIPVKVWDTGEIPFKVITDGKDVTSTVTDMSVENGTDRAINFDPETGKWECVKCDLKDTLVKRTWKFSNTANGKKQTHEHEVTFKIEAGVEPLFTIVQTPPNVVFEQGKSKTTVITVDYCGKPVMSGISYLENKSSLPPMSRMGIEITPTESNFNVLFEGPAPFKASPKLVFGYLGETTGANTATLEFDVNITTPNPPLKLNVYSPISKFPIGIWTDIPFTITDTAGTNLIKDPNILEMGPKEIVEYDPVTKKMRLNSETEPNVKLPVKVILKVKDEGFYREYYFDLDVIGSFSNSGIPTFIPEYTSVKASEKGRMVFFVKNGDVPVVNIGKITTQNLTTLDNSATNFVVDNDWRVEDPYTGKVSVGYVSSDVTGTYKLTVGITYKDSTNVLSPPTIIITCSQADIFVAKVGGPEVKYNSENNITVKVYRNIGDENPPVQLTGKLKTYAYNGFSGISQGSSERNDLSSWSIMCRGDGNKGTAYISLDFEEKGGNKYGSLAIHLIKV